MPSQQTALIVEDEPNANSLLARLIQLKGFQTESAYTGGEALEKIRTNVPDIVFLDLMLPDIDGFQVCRAIKTDPETSLVPVVIVSAALVGANRSRGFRAGADTYVPKPYMPQDIFQVLTDVKEWRKSAEALAGRFTLDLAAGDEMERNLGRLQSLLVARTKLSQDEIQQIAHAPRGLLTVRANGNGQATNGKAIRVDYVLEPEVFRLTVADESHSASDAWFTEIEGEVHQEVSEHLAHFDTIESSAADRSITLLKRL